MPCAIVNPLSMWLFYFLRANSLVYCWLKTGEASAIESLMTCGMHEVRFREFREFPIRID